MNSGNPLNGVDMNRKLQREVMDRDKVCVLCGSDFGLEVHHFKDFVPGLGFISAYENECKELLDVLCEEHHGWINGAKGRKNWETRRALILYKFKVDIGFCRRHIWIHPGEVTYCRNCTMLKLVFDQNQRNPKSPIEKTNEGV